MKIFNFKLANNNKCNLLLVSIGLVLLMTNCTSNIEEEVIALKSKIDDAISEGYHPPQEAYYDAIRTFSFLPKSSFDDAQQLNRYSYLKMKENSQLKALCRSFRHCVEQTSELMYDHLDSIYSEKEIIIDQDRAKELLKIKKEEIFIWALGISDTIAIFDQEIVSILTQIESDYHYFERNCQNWEPFVSHVQNCYNLRIKDLPCDINFILKINGLVLLEKIEDELIDSFEMRLQSVLFEEK